LLTKTSLAKFRETL
jgi:hypothetical protein